MNLSISKMGTSRYTFRKKNGDSYQVHRNNISVHKMARTYVKSYLNQYKDNDEMLKNFIYPTKYGYTYTWWDATPGGPKVWKHTLML